MSTAAATAQAEPPAPPPIRPLLETGRISAEGHKHLAPAWLTLESAADFDRFYETPAPFLFGAFGAGLVAPFQILHLLDDKCTTYSECLLLMVQHDFADVRELRREKLSASLPNTDALGWSVAHSPHLSWHVQKDGRPVQKLTGFRNHNSAYSAMVAEVANWRNLAATTHNPQAAEYKNEGMQK
jgi:hypothetical protein